MTATTSTSSATAIEVVTAFFDAYRSRDVEAMVDLCTDNADFDYVPYEVVGRQRTVRGKGKVRGIGKTIWSSLITSFPDLTNEVTSMAADDAGNVAVEVHIGGKQAKSFGTLPQTGDAYWLPHLFMFHVDNEGLIDLSRAYWDNADWFAQMGWKEVS